MTRSDPGSKGSARGLPSFVLTALLASACGTAPVRPTSAETPVKPPHLSHTKFVAFGDTITEGSVEDCLSDAEPGEDVEPYPVKLQALLNERYPTQSVSVVNEGAGGADIQTAATDLQRVLTVDAPQVLLLQAGINTLNAMNAAGIQPIVESLRAMIQEGRRRGAVVFVGTLLPEREGGCRADDYADGVDDIVMANVQIRGMVGAEGAYLVDLYEAFNGRTAMLLGKDGLHPNEAGYQQVAEAFLAAIAKRLED